MFQWIPVLCGIKIITCSYVVFCTCCKEISWADILVLEKLTRKTLCPPSMSPLIRFMVQNGVVWEQGYNSSPFSQPMNWQATGEKSIIPRQFCFLSVMVYPQLATKDHRATHSLTPTTAGMKRIIGKKYKFLDQDKNSLIIEPNWKIAIIIITAIIIERGTQHRKMKWLIIQVLTTHSSMLSPSPSSDYPLPTNSSQSYTENNVLVYGMFIQTIWVSSPSCTPSLLLVHPLTVRAWDTEMSLIHSKHYLATNKIVVCYQQYPCTKSKTQDCASY